MQHHLNLPAVWLPAGDGGMDDPTADKVPAPAPRGVSDPAPALPATGVVGPPPPMSSSPMPCLRVAVERLSAAAGDPGMESGIGAAPAIGLATASDPSAAGSAVCMPMILGHIETRLRCQSSSSDLSCVLIRISSYGVTIWRPDTPAHTCDHTHTHSHNTRKQLPRPRCAMRSYTTTHRHTH